MENKNSLALALAVRAKSRKQALRAPQPELLDETDDTWLDEPLDEPLGDTTNLAAESAPEPESKVQSIINNIRRRNATLPEGA